MWRQSAGWDERIQEDLRQQWNDWLACLVRLGEIRVPRWIGDLGEEVDIHIFVDASESCMAAAAYVFNGQSGALVTAKCKVAPLRVKSIPRLELDAAVLGVRVLGIVRASKCWRVRSVNMWSDARDVLYWIRCHRRRYTSYVANRVGAILRETLEEEWRWVPTSENPADWATKFAHHQQDESLWWNGPDFLRQPKDQWPDSFVEPDVVQEVVRVMVTGQRPATNPLLPPFESFSTWERVVHNVACVYVFIDIVQRKRLPGRITEEERDAAKTIIYQEIQKEMSAAEMERFSPFQDEQQVWRMRGRTASASHMSYSARYPVILPSRHRITMLICDFYHRISAHSHAQRALNELRQVFVIAHPRREMNRVMKQCQRCRLHRTLPTPAEMAALPISRLAFRHRPFTYCGADLFGPIIVCVGRRREKRWGVLFTCLTTRAIYMEIVNALSAEAVMMAMDSLAARRGPPRQYTTDCGTNFVAAAKRYRDPNGLRPEWKFNAPQTPHTGGAWERMIGITKRVLERMEMEKTPTEQRLRWFLCRAELLINSRPLTDVPQDSEAEAAITPNDILIGSSSGMKTTWDEGHEDLTAFLSERDEDIHRFWSRWTKEYLPTIAARSKWRQKVEPVAVGDVVYLCDSDYRYGWRKARVEEVMIDKEAQQVRQVVLRTADGTRYRKRVSGVAVIARNNSAE